MEQDKRTNATNEIQEISFSKQLLEKGASLILEKLVSPCPEETKLLSFVPELDAFVSACLTRAKEIIVSMPQYDYEEFLANLVVLYIQPGYDEIAFNLRDKNRLSLIRFIVLLNTKIKQSGRSMPLLRISPETIDAEAGFLLKCGMQVIDCTVDALLASKKESLLPALAELLGALESK